MFAHDGIDPYPDGWFAVKPHVIHAHAKDAVGRGGEAMSIEFGTGEIDWQGQLWSLTHGWDENGIISLETHWRKDRELDAATTHQPGGAAFTTVDSEESSRVCMANLIRMLQEAQAEQG